MGQVLARRWLRTLSLYCVALVSFSFSLGRTSPAPYFFLQGQGPFSDRIPAVSWSLVLERYFYFFFPLLLAVALALGGPRLRSARGGGGACPGGDHRLRRGAHRHQLWPAAGEVN